MTSNMRLITFYLSPERIKQLDKLVKAKKFPNRAEAIRVAVRDLILSET